MRFRGVPRKAPSLYVCLALAVGLALGYGASFLSSSCVRTSGTGQVVHSCGPSGPERLQSSPGAEPDGPRNLTGGLIEWLHIPKAGTSFGNTLLLWACPELNASVTWVTDDEVLPLPASCLARFRTNERKKWPIGNHVPLAGRSEAELHNVFTLVRHPHSRAVSGFHYLTDYKRVGATRYEICDYVRSHPEAHVNLGAQVKLVTGEAEFTWPSNFAFAAKYAPLPPDSLVDAACQRLRSFAFVGLSEHWNATVCLFHAMYGGPVHGVELQNVRKGKYGGVGLFHSLDCGDTADERMYACAKALFLERMEQHPHCIRSM